MRVLIGCESSGRVRDAFIRRGHDAVSCDLLPSEAPGPHIQDDIFRHLNEAWDIAVFFYPCTNLCVSGARWFKNKREVQARDVANFRRLMECGIPKIAAENPIGVLSRLYRKPDQIIQPWQFGHEATKATCLWLKGLPLLKPTKIVVKGARHVTKSGRSLPEWYNLPPSPDRAKIRSRTFEGIADAMAAQWSVETVPEKRLELRFAP